MDKTPERPRFICESVVIDTDGGLLIDGGPRVIHIKAPRDRGELRRLIELMDGTRALADLNASTTGYSPDQSDRLVHLLNAAGLIDEGSSEASHTEAAAFWRRLGRPWTARDGSAVMQTLSRHSVSLVGGSVSERRLMIDLLLQAGVGTCVDGGNAAAPSRWLSDRALVVALSIGRDNVARLSGLDEYCRSNGLRWLRIHLDRVAAGVVVGPLFEPWVSPCYPCFHRRSCRPRLGLERRSGYRPLCRLWLSWAVLEILAILLDSSTALKPGRSRVIRSSALSSYDTLSLPQVGCSRCQPPYSRRHSRLRTINVALLYEQALLYNRRVAGDHRLLSGAGQAHTYRLIVPQPGPILPLNDSLPTITGSTLGLLMKGDARIRARSINLVQLSALLRLSLGRSFDTGEPSGRPSRYVPSAGNLASQHGFIVLRSKAGEVGVYEYDRRFHSLSFCDGADVGAKSFARGCARSWLVLVGRLTDLRRKYGPLSYRLVLMDAGVAAAQVMAVAAGLGMPAAMQQAWPDGLLRFRLHLATDDDLITSVIAIGHRTPLTLTGPEPIAIEKASPWVSSHKGRESDLESIVRGVVLDGAYRSVSTRSHSTRPAVTTTHIPPIALPTATGQSAPLAQALHTRKSSRRFSETPVAMRDVAALLQALDWPHHIPTHLFRVRVLALAVAGILPGIYLYSHRQNSLRRCQVGSCVAGVGWYVQPELATAPLHIWVTGKLFDACRRYGAWGHRQLLLGAGFGAQRLSLAAASIGLSGTIVAGLIGGQFQQHCQIDGVNEVMLLSYVSGYEQ